MTDLENLMHARADHFFFKFKNLKFVSFWLSLRSAQSELSLKAEIHNVNAKH